MHISLHDVAHAIARWSTSLKDDLHTLRDDAHELLAQLKHRWNTDPDFRSQVILEAVEGPLVVVMRGPRATILYIAGVAVSLVVVILTALTDEAGGTSPAL